MKKISLAILTLIVVLASCKKTPEVNLKYVDVERDLVTVGTTTANIQCDYEYIATLKKAYLYYGEGESETNMTSAEMRVVQNTLYVELTGLKENTLYSYYYEFHNGFNSMRTALKTFKTEAGSGGGEEPPTPEITLPTVITAPATEITANSAKGGGEVTNDGGAEVTERGVCWSIDANPTLNDTYITAGTGTGAFTVSMSGLEANTAYHVRAYAINEKGTAYGLDKEFTTLSGGGSVPEGAINGLFTINENGDQVYFSKGNLQYQASTNTWRFAEHQWDYVGGVDPVTGMDLGNVFENEVKCDNALISSSYSGWIDFFGWGTSGYSHGAICYQPWSTSLTNSDYYVYGSSQYNLHDQTGQADWGYNAISNGGSQENYWRTLTQSEWDYVFNIRNNISGVRYAKANVNGVNGVILLPDEWSESVFSLNNTNNDEAGFSINAITAIQWTSIEVAGAVFLPASGARNGTLVYGVDSTGIYWSASYKPIYNNNTAYDVYINDFHLFTNGNGDRYCGWSVRLVQDANP